MADDFGYNPFSSGDGGFFQPITEENIVAFDPGVTGVIPVVQPSVSSGGLLNAVGAFANLGRTITNDVFSYKLQQNQVNHGQLPSIATDKTGRPSGQLQQLTTAVQAGSWGTIALVGGAGLLLVVLMTAGRR